jgi:hypothetical protein
MANRFSSQCHLLTNIKIVKTKQVNSTIPSRRCLGTEQLEHLRIDYCQQDASELPESLLAKHRIMLNLGNNFHVEQW